jgi:hypothetical protein
MTIGKNRDMYRSRTTKTFKLAEARNEEEALGVLWAQRAIRRRDQEEEREERRKARLKARITLPAVDLPDVGDPPRDWTRR